MCRQLQQGGNSNDLSMQHRAGVRRCEHGDQARCGRLLCVSEPKIADLHDIVTVVSVLTSRCQVVELDGILENDVRNSAEQASHAVSDQHKLPVSHGFQNMI